MFRYYCLGPLNSNLCHFLFVLQRGSEELLSHSPMVTNGTTMSPQHINQDLNNDAKKVRIGNGGLSFCKTLKVMLCGGKMVKAIYHTDK